MCCRNVFMDKNLVAKVADFGMVTSSKESSEPCGTPQWVAPEAIPNFLNKKANYDRRCDLYR
jgi:serine/threonine protein kinase